MKVLIDHVRQVEAEQVVISEGFVYIEGREPIRWFLSVEIQP